MTKAIKYLLLQFNKYNKNMSNDIIYFYETFDGQSKPEHKFLNNFEISPFISSSGELFLSVEHYYQAHKFGDFSIENNKGRYDEIKNSENPDLCKKAARRITKELGDNGWNKKEWDEKLKDYYMKRGLTYKFSQNKDMLEKLILTGDKILKEESKKDAYWGGLIEGSKNMLGNMLMEIRDNYKKSNEIFLEGSKLDRIKVNL